MTITAAHCIGSHHVVLVAKMAATVWTRNVFGWESEPSRRTVYGISIPSTLQAIPNTA